GLVTCKGPHPHLACQQAAVNQSCQWTAQPRSDQLSQPHLACQQAAVNQSCQWTAQPRSDQLSQPHLACQQAAVNQSCQWTAQSRSDQLSQPHLACQQAAVNQSCQWTAQPKQKSAQLNQLRLACQQAAVNQSCQWTAQPKQKSAQLNQLRLACQQAAVNQNRQCTPEPEQRIAVAHEKQQQNKDKSEEPAHSTLSLHTSGPAKKNSGSMASYITKDLVKELQPPRVVAEQMKVEAFGGSTNDSFKFYSPMYELKLQRSDETWENCVLNRVQEITNPFNTVYCDDNKEFMPGADFRDSITISHEAPAIMIGIRDFWKYNTIWDSILPGLHLIDTFFGKMPGGESTFRLHSSNRSVAVISINSSNGKRMSTNNNEKLLIFNGGRTQLRTEKTNGTNKAIIKKWYPRPRTKYKTTLDVVTPWTLEITCLLNKLMSICYCIAGCGTLCTRKTTQQAQTLAKTTGIATRARIVRQQLNQASRNLQQTGQEWRRAHLDRILGRRPVPTNWIPLVALLTLAKQTYSSNTVAVTTKSVSCRRGPTGILFVLNYATTLTLLPKGQTTTLLLRNEHGIASGTLSIIVDALTMDCVPKSEGWYRSYTTGNTFELITCPTWEFNIHASLQLEVSGKKPLMESIVLHPGMTFNCNVSVTPIAVTASPAPVMNRQFITDGTSVTMVENIPQAISSITSLLLALIIGIGLLYLFVRLNLVFRVWKASARLVLFITQLLLCFATQAPGGPYGREKMQTSTYVNFGLEPRLNTLIEVSTTSTLCLESRKTYGKTWHAHFEKLAPPTLLTSLTTTNLYQWSRPLLAIKAQLSMPSIRHFNNLEKLLKNMMRLLTIDQIIPNQLDSWLDYHHPGWNRDEKTKFEAGVAIVQILETESAELKVLTAERTVRRSSRLAGFTELPANKELIMPNCTVDRHYWNKGVTLIRPDLPCMIFGNPLERANR
uniref:Phlebovirus glycoprotein G2 fusion domain-containing protein n=1 Tax=Meloidogyne incognita TaxID=6306 RepID=A0A914NQW1_MELIC